MVDLPEFPPSSPESLSPLTVEGPENIWWSFTCYYLREFLEFCVCRLKMNETHLEFFIGHAEPSPEQSYGKKCKHN